ncbi:gap junction delta-3 protein isoform X1 [Hyla sarda]|uniref:gap junction delta-3 protein isoform X1 n=2 Tax=Hyla sarda TaxID=327740 RepID=UPI0024C3CCFB|nr:gap junction delta-3 protein isoform X1 [Hyla sarda]XP_056404523.1 gap junction delta-3 protein isoform X1 [Hyla sarda]
MQARQEQASRIRFDMGEWGFLSSLLDAVQEHSPMVGRFWLVVMLIFRILILATVGSDMFEDEQEEFVCNTLQPGCRQVCYDQAFPISHYRFWVFHIVLLSAPAVLFVIYSMHQNTKIGRDAEDAAAQHGQQTSTRTKLRAEQRGRHIRTFYIINVVMRILAEVGFLVGQWLLYGFKVSPEYACVRFPCPNIVDCFVSRPTEKTIFLNFYFVVGIISAVLSLSELLHILVKGKCRSRDGLGPSPPPAYERDNWSNREHERTNHLFLQRQTNDERRASGAGGHRLSIAYPPGSAYKLKVTPSSAISSKSSRLIKGDLTV